MKKLILLLLLMTMLTGCCISHEWAEADCVTAKTCTKCGETEGEALEHTWAEATCTAPKTCTVCGKTEGEMLNHSFAEATCAAPMTCTVCGQTEGEALAHSFSEWAELTDGAQRTCSVCSTNETMDAEMWAAHQFIVGKWHGFAIGSSENYLDTTNKIDAANYSISFHNDGTFEQICTLYTEPVQTGHWTCLSTEKGGNVMKYQYSIELDKASAADFLSGSDFQNVYTFNPFKANESLQSMFEQMLTANFNVIAKAAQGDYHTCRKTMFASTENFRKLFALNDITENHITHMMELEDNTIFVFYEKVY